MYEELNELDQSSQLSEEGIESLMKKYEVSEEEGEEPVDKMARMQMIKETISHAFVKIITKAHSIGKEPLKNEELEASVIGMRENQI